MIYVIYLNALMLLNQVRKWNSNLKHYTMYSQIADMHETQVYKVLNHVKKFKIIQNTLPLNNV